ncbi:MAG: aminotransferase class I and II [Thermoleophilia bacterium]|nr:aminotransferase class I and II [Thermoleophilia bacterium]
MRTVLATRYVEPLREGGSLPALVEGDDDGLYVLKFRGAGQGPSVLVAEIVAGETARLLGLPVPELVYVEVPPELGLAEPDPEIQDLLKASVGRNLGMDFLPGALAYDPAAAVPPDPAFAADVVWFDALMLNVDRSARNPNLLVWHGRHHLIDHGAALYPHHGDPHIAAAWDRVLPSPGDHVLMPAAGSIAGADARLGGRLGPADLAEVVSLIPGEWLAADGLRDEYAEFIRRRLEGPRRFAEAAEEARARI